MIAPLFGYVVTPAAAPAAVPVPTSTNAQRFYNQIDAPATSQEQNIPALQSTAHPAVAPANVVHLAAPTVQPAQFSPIDLGSAPVPTAQSILTQEQLEASAASEEVNQLNTQQQGLTEAQRMVQTHDAEWTARQP